MERTTGLATLARVAPDWRRWITLLQRTLAEAERPEWDDMVPHQTADETHASEGDCLLTGARIVINPRAIERLTRALSEAAGARGHARPAGALCARLLEAGLEADDDAAPALAADLGVPPDVLGAITPLIAMPLLIACRRRWAARQPPAWPHGYCPVCAAWPVLAEARGLERTRQLRCGRCGSDWRFDWLRCPFCRCTDHERLGALVPGDGGDARRVEVCHACRGYVKTLTTLEATPSEDLSARDLDTLELDLVALERGFARPGRLARALGARIEPRAARAIARWMRR
jgi:FdhE protein